MEPRRPDLWSRGAVFATVIALNAEDHSINLFRSAMERRCRQS